MTTTFGITEYRHTLDQWYDLHYGDWGTALVQAPVDRTIGLDVFDFEGLPDDDNEILPLASEAKMGNFRRPDFTKARVANSRIRKTNR